jgi:hypothetical protein
VPRRETTTIVVLVRGGAEVAIWPLAGVTRPDLSVVEKLARLLLVARRLGCSIRLRDASSELVELLQLAGLAGLAGLPGLAGLGEPAELVTSELVTSDGGPVPPRATPSRLPAAKPGSDAP